MSLSRVSQDQGECEGHVNGQHQKPGHNEHQSKRNVHWRVSVKVKMRAKFMDKVKFQVERDWSQCQDQSQVWVGKGLPKN